jgi:hypothetical protein
MKKKRPLPAFGRRRDMRKVLCRHENPRKVCHGGFTTATVSGKQFVQGNEWGGREFAHPAMFRRRASCLADGRHAGHAYEEACGLVAGVVFQPVQGCTLTSTPLDN